MSKLKQHNLFGIDIDNISPENLIEFLEERIENNEKPIQVITLNPEMLVEARKNKKFKNILKNTNLVLADGIGIVLAAKIFLSTNQGSLRSKGSSKEKLCRIPGTDIVRMILEKLDKEKVFLFGSTLNVVEKIAKTKNYNIVGVSSGYNIEDREVIERINKSRASILLVGIGSPKQEIWIDENLSKLEHVKIAIGVGGAFDFLSGKVKRAPMWLRKVGLEWLWRLVLEPKRIKRIFRAVIIFPLLVIKDKLKKPKHAKR